MDVYIFQAALLCSDCGTAARDRLPLPPGAIVDNESTYDSDVYPKGPYSNGGGWQSDMPEHCDACRVFLHNPLTDDGRAYVRSALESAPDPELLDAANRLLVLIPRKMSPRHPEWFSVTLARAVIGRVQHRAKTLATWRAAYWQELGLDCPESGA